MRLFLACVMALSTFLSPQIVRGYYSLGPPEGYVTDQAGLFSPEQRQELEHQLQDFETRTSNEVAVVTIPSLKGDTIEHFAVKLFEEWQIGKKKEDNGILLLVAKEDREVRIEVGYGLEGALTDAESSRIIRNVVVPAFKENNFYGGIKEAIDTIETATAGEYGGTQEDEDGENAIGALLFFGIFALQWLLAILARSKSWWAGGVIGAVIGVVITLIKGFLYFGLISMALLIPLGLLLDFIVSKSYRENRAQNRTIPWWAGGNSWSRGSSSGGFGGFGGGSSGGGGASGRW